MRDTPTTRMGGQSCSTRGRDETDLEKKIEKSQIQRVYKLFGFSYILLVKTNNKDLKNEKDQPRYRRSL